ncbi:DedA family protein [Paenibacillus sediminis]|uniref:Membrane protein DedA with SNARE-associated domain n=1 Tax=Paenibacillus sediminis TaxID=664909 RepID=A0ABS4H127_9BACL|nr:DedA family protein [Paenibacillus sediminis]MBP1936171.1 membrane protein DedA with SNARE-associated domain [Paenibacillus sediminis]
MLHSLIEFISSIAAYFVQSFGVVGIFMAMMLESACIPLPSEVIMLTGGFIVHQGSFPFWEVVCAGVLGNLVGSMLIYWVGAKGARSVLEKYGKFILLNHKHLRQSELWFKKYGEWTAFFSRNLPFVRTFISLPAGISGMNFYKFCMYTFLGCLPWNIALTYLGYKLGENWKIVESFIHPVTYGVIALMILLIARYVMKAMRQKKQLTLYKLLRENNEEL